MYDSVCMGCSLSIHLTDTLNLLIYFNVWVLLPSRTTGEKFLRTALHVSRVQRLRLVSFVGQKYTAIIIVI